MISCTQNKQKPAFRRFFVLACLYTAQTLPGHFATNAIPIIMRYEGFSLERIGLLGLVGLPWALKFLWAPAVDRYGGKNNHYRKWALIMQLLFAMVTLSTAFVSLRDHLCLVAALMTLSFAFSATQDIAVDAYAIKILDHAERAMGNAIQTAGNMLGVVLGSSAAFILYIHTSWESTLMALSAATLLLGLPMLFAGEPPATPADSAGFSDFITFLKKRDVSRWALAGLLISGAIFSVITMYKPLLVDRGYDQQFISLALGIYPLSGIPAAIVTGMLIRRWGINRVFTLCCLLTAVGCCAFIPPARGHFTGILIIAMASIHMVFAMLITILNTFAMSIARPGREGTDFTFFLALPFIGGMLCVGASGVIVQSFGYTLFFAGAAIFAVGCAVVFHWRPLRIQEQL